MRRLSSLALAACVPLATSGASSYVPTGMRVTPDAAPGSSYQRLATGLRDDGNADATDASALALSPDGKTLLVMTSGYNLNFRTTDGTIISHQPIDPKTGLPDASAKAVNKAEWVFVYDTSGATPQAIQRIEIPDTYAGIAWGADGSRFYVSGGIDDRVYVFGLLPGTEVPPPGKTRVYSAMPSLTLGHNAKDSDPVPDYDGGLLKGTPAAAKVKEIATGAVVAGIAPGADGHTVYAANLENDSLSIVRDDGTVSDVPFTRPGAETGHGEFPYGVAVRSGAGGAAQTVYVSSQRDGEVMAVTPGAAGKARARAIAVCSGPNALALSRDGARLYVVCGNEDALAIVDTARGTRSAKVPLGRPGDPYRGANPNSLAISPDGARAYVTLGGENAIAVVDLRAKRVLGRIPTGWYPTGVAVSPDGARLYVCNEKSDPGPDNDNGFGTATGRARNTAHQNQYGWAQEKAGLLTLAVPSDAQLAALSRLVDANDGFAERAKAHALDFLRGKIKHVIYITDENRTYDQVLGDLPRTNGDPGLNTFPQAISPNHHAFASDFVALDNFYDPGESSGVGWNWSVAGHTNDYVERAQAVLYGNAFFAGLTYDYQGIVRNLNLALPQTGGSTVFNERATGLLDPSGASSILPGPRDPAANDGDGDLRPGALGGYLWDEALRRGLTVRNYGEHVDLTFYDPGPQHVSVSRTPYASHVQQAVADKSDLLPRTDAYYRGFDQAVPDQYRIDEWQREFDGFVKHHDLPGLEMMTVPHDHFGSFAAALDGLNTPQLQFADNDYALGRIVEAVSHSPYWKDTAILIDEDDSQSGPDHVSTHRSTAFVVSAYTRRHFVDHERYTTDNLLRTIEALLGLRPLGLNDANAAPMARDFTPKADFHAYRAVVPGSLCGGGVSPELLAGACTAPGRTKTAFVPQLRSGAWWTAMTAGMDFSRPDALDGERFNAIVWAGTKGTLAPLF